MEIPDRIARWAPRLAAITMFPDIVNLPEGRRALFGHRNAEAHAVGVREFTLES